MRSTKRERAGQRVARALYARRHSLRAESDAARGRVRPCFLEEWARGGDRRVAGHSLARSLAFSSDGWSKEFTLQKSLGRWLCGISTAVEGRVHGRCGYRHPAPSRVSHEHHFMEWHEWGVTVERGGVVDRDHLPYFDTASAPESVLDSGHLIVRRPKSVWSC